MHEIVLVWSSMWGAKQSEANQRRKKSKDKFTSIPRIINAIKNYLIQEFFNKEA